MTSEKFHDALNLLPADLVAETDALRTQAKKPQVHWQRWAAMAACLAVVLLAGTMFSYFFGHMGSSKTAAAGMFVVAHLLSTSEADYCRDFRRLNTN